MGGEVPGIYESKPFCGCPPRLLVAAKDSCVGLFLPAARATMIETVKKEQHHGTGVIGSETLDFGIV